LKLEEDSGLYVELLVEGLVMALLSQNYFEELSQEDLLNGKSQGHCWNSRLIDP
jgi:hypothetical protein